MFKKLSFVFACLLLFSVTPVMAQDYCDADCDSNGKVDLSDLVILRGEFLRTDCAPCQTVAALETRIASLETQLAQVTALLANVTRGTVQGQDTIRFSGVNVQIVDGSGDTFGTVNGRGNLIVGYNEFIGGDRTGSHNIVVGPFHKYSSYGGLVAGVDNTISGPYASVSGGSSNTASAEASSVSGGESNTASYSDSSVSGGRYNTASGYISSVSGGLWNTASGNYASVSGGNYNTASGNYGSSVSGGVQNIASGSSSSVSGGVYNTASGQNASVSGGSSNTASGQESSVSGGEFNKAIGFGSFVGGGGGSGSWLGNYAVADYSAILGGTNNTAGDSNRVDTTIGYWATVSGGNDNIASGDASSVSGGDNRSVAGDYDWAAGGLFQDN